MSELFDHIDEALLSYAEVADRLPTRDALATSAREDLKQAVEEKRIDDDFAGKSFVKWFHEKY